MNTFNRSTLKILPIIICFALLTMLVPAAMTATITITLDNVTTSVCNTIWNEAGCHLWFTETTPEDLTFPYCLVYPSASIVGETGVYIWPARLGVSLINMTGVQTIEIDVYETHFAGSTRAFLYSDGTPVDSHWSFQEDLQTLSLDVGENIVDQFAVSGHESYVLEIRIIGADLVPVQQQLFETVKALYR